MKIKVLDVTVTGDMIGIVVSTDGDVVIASAVIPPNCVMTFEDIMAQVRSNIMQEVERRLFNDFNVRG